MRVNLTIGQLIDLQGLAVRRYLATIDLHGKLPHRRDWIEERLREWAALILELDAAIRAYWTL